MIKHPNVSIQFVILVCSRHVFATNLNTRMNKKYTTHVNRRGLEEIGCRRVSTVFMRR